MRLALFQGPETSGDVAANLAALDAAAAAASGADADLLVCPEMAVSGYNIGPLARERAEPADGPVYERVAGTARGHGLAIAYGYPELAGGGVYNATQVVDRDGRVLARYRKCHLYGDLDRDLFLPGEQGVVQFDLAGLRVGLLTCYDVEFPEAVRAHALAGAELLVVPTGLMSPYEIVAHTLVPARAYESQVFVAYANRTGVEGDLEYCGLSCVVGPDGVDLARGGAGEELLVADVHRSALETSRAVNTHLADRRPELYPGVAASPLGSHS
jgi:nitrilase